MNLICASLCAPLCLPWLKPFVAVTIGTPLAISNRRCPAIAARMRSALHLPRASSFGRRLKVALCKPQIFSECLLTIPGRIANVSPRYGPLDPRIASDGWPIFSPQRSSGSNGFRNVPRPCRYGLARPLTIASGWPMRWRQRGEIILPSLRQRPPALRSTTKSNTATPRANPGPAVWRTFDARAFSLGVSSWADRSADALFGCDARFHGFHSRRAPRICGVADSRDVTN